MKYYCGNENCEEKIKGTCTCTLSEESRAKCCPYIVQTAEEAKTSEEK